MTFENVLSEVTFVLVVSTIFVAGVFFGIAIANINVAVDKIKKLNKE